MNKSAMLFIAAIMPLLAGACTATGSTQAVSMTAAPLRDAAYCQMLIGKYTTYVGSVGGSLGGTSDRGIRADLDAKVAIPNARRVTPTPRSPCSNRSCATLASLCCRAPLDREISHAFDGVHGGRFGA